MKAFDKLIHYLPLGYLYLVVLGIFKEGITFYQIGVNIMSYTSIMDVLLSPVAALTSHPLVLGATIVFVAYLYFSPVFMIRKIKKDWVPKLMGSKIPYAELTEEDKKTIALNYFIKMLAFGCFGFFTGIGFSQGYSFAKDIKNDKLKYKHRISFSSGKTEDVSLLESNSTYYFYVSKGNKNVKITPVSSINTIEMIDNKMLKK